MGCGATVSDLALTALDDQIPLILSKLQQRGVRENTLIIFTSDNGYLLGRHGLWSDGLRSGADRARRPDPADSVEAAAAWSAREYADHLHQRQRLPARSAWAVERRS